MEKIIVGYDGSELSAHALRWAVERADDDDLVVVAVIWTIPFAVGYDVPLPNLDALGEAADNVADDAIAAIDSDDGPKLEKYVTSGDPGVLLTVLSESSDMVVVGSRGRGGLRSALLGSVSNYVVHHAHCPVVVIPQNAVESD